MIDSTTYYGRRIAEDHAACDDALDQKYVYIIQDTMQKFLLVLHVGIKQSKMIGNNGVWLIQ